MLHDLAQPCKQKFQEMSDAMSKSPCIKFRKYFDFAGMSENTFQSFNILTKKSNTWAFFKAGNLGKQIRLEMPIYTCAHFTWPNYVNCFTGFNLDYFIQSVDASTSAQPQGHLGGFFWPQTFLI